MSIVLEAQVAALLARLESNRERTCRDLVGAAHAQAQQILRDARHQGHARLRTAVLEKRARVLERCRRVQLELEARARQAEFAELRDLLDTGVKRLPRVLAERWSDPAERRVWWKGALARAAASLAPGGWEVEFAPGPDAAELEALLAEARTLGVTIASTREVAELGAGLRILQGGTRLDASPTGLMSDRAQLEAALLAELSTPAAQGGSP
jgi:hypothetical protein